MAEDGRPDAVDAARFRAVMGRFTTGVTVITTEARGEIRGMTANAFMSASLNPPLCVIAVAMDARIHDYLVQAGHFGVNILAQGQEALSAHFAGRPVAALDIRFCRQGRIPLLADASAVIAARCVARHGCGDHTLFVGRVLHLRADDRPPLVVHAGRYGAIRYQGGGAESAALEFW